MFRSTGGADAPVDDFCFIDGKAVTIGSGETGGVTHGAVNIANLATGATDHVVMVVADAPLKSGRRAAWLDAASEPVVAEGAERVVDGLH